MLTWHSRAVAACKLAESTPHDWRHSYIVNALRRGDDVSVVAHQLSDANPYLVWTRYGSPRARLPGLPSKQVRPFDYQCDYHTLTARITGYAQQRFSKCPGRGSNPYEVAFDGF